VDSTVQETITVMQNDIDLIESSIAALPTTYQTILNNSTNRLPYTFLSGTPDLALYAPLASPTFTGTLKSNSLSSTSGQEMFIRTNNDSSTNIRLFTNGNVAVASVLTNHVGAQNLVIRPTTGRDLVLQNNSSGSTFNDVLRIHGSLGQLTFSYSTVGISYNDLSNRPDLSPYALNSSLAIYAIRSAINEFSAIQNFNARINCINPSKFGMITVLDGQSTITLRPGSTQATATFFRDTDTTFNTNVVINGNISVTGTSPYALSSSLSSYAPLTDPVFRNNITVQNDINCVPIRL